MNKKEIEVENGIFTITSLTELNSEINIEEFKNELIKIYFKPDQPMSSNEIRQAVEPHEPMLLKEIQLITNSFPEIYGNFDFDKNFYYYSFDVISLSPKDLNRGLSLSVMVKINNKTST